MRKLTISLLIITTLFSTTKAQTNKYLIGNEQAPEDTPKIYGANIISKDNLKIYGISFSPDGTELVYAERSNGLYYMKRVNNTWTIPERMDVSKDLLTHVMYPKFSPDGKFISYVDGNSKDYGYGDIYKIERQSDSSWSKPIKLPAPFNSSLREAGHCFTLKGDLFFNSGRYDKDLPHADMYRTKTIKDSIIVELVPELSHFAIHTDEECLYISPDESYIITDTWHLGSKRKRELFIAFKRDNNNWTDPIRLNNKINTYQMDGMPFVTSDNKYLFFTRSLPTGGNSIFWVSTKEIFTPYLNLAIPDFHLLVNNEFEIEIEILKNTFKDFNGEIVHYELILYGNKELPDWISFDSENLTIKGKAITPQILHLELTAIDNDKNRERIDFKLMIEQ